MILPLLDVVIGPISIVIQYVNPIITKRLMREKIRDVDRSRRSTKIRQRVRKLVDHPTFQKTIMTLIVINAVTLGFETSPTIMGYIGPALQVFDKIVIAIFCVEIVLRIYAHGPAFFRDPWGIFDFIVVAITLTPSNDSLSVLRSLRVLRVLRLVSAVPRLRRIVSALLLAVPGVGAIVALLLLVFYVFAVITTKLLELLFPIGSVPSAIPCSHYFRL